MATSQLSILTLDTSAINRLADDPDCEALTAGLRSRFHLRLSFTSVSELLATENCWRRRKLLGVCRRLLESGDCIDPQHEIIRKMVSRFEASPSFDWRDVYVRFPQAEIEISRREDISDDEAAQEREDARANNKVFVAVYDDTKPAFDRLFAAGTERLPGSVSELVTQLQGGGGAFWTLAANLYARVATKPVDETTIRRFAMRCDPFRALMIALVAAQYERCVRPRHARPSLRSGRNDTFMSVCLPYCHQFVTDDLGQLACYKEVVSVGNLDVTVRSYEEFHSGFLAMGATAGLAT
jgi:hypothetical protein